MTCAHRRVNYTNPLTCMDCGAQVGEGIKVVTGDGRAYLRHHNRAHEYPPTLRMSGRAMRDLMWGNGQDILACTDPTPDEVATRRWQGTLRAMITVVCLASLERS